MNVMKRIRLNKKGQFVIMAALLVVLIVLAIALDIYVASNVHHEFRYKSYKEIVENADSDFQNALILALANATHAYANIPLGAPLTHTGDTQSYEVLRNAALSSLNFWKLTSTRAFAGTGFSPEFKFDRATLLQNRKETPMYTVPNRWLYNLTKVYWFHPESISAIGSDIALNVTGMGFYGFKSYHMAYLRLVVDVEDLDQQFSSGSVDHLKVTLLKEHDDPLYDLSNKNFLLVSFDLNTGTWKNVPITQVKYLGAGNYTLSFPSSAVAAGTTTTKGGSPAPPAPKYVDQQQVQSTITTTTTTTTATTRTTTTTIPTKTVTSTYQTASTVIVSRQTTTTTTSTRVTTSSVASTRTITTTFTQVQTIPTRSTTSTRTVSTTTTLTSTLTSTSTILTTTVTETTTVPSSTLTTTTTTTDSITSTSTLTVTKTTTVTAAPAPPRPLGVEPPPPPTTTTTTLTQTMTETRTGTTYITTTTTTSTTSLTTTLTSYTSTTTRTTTRTATTTVVTSTSTSTTTRTGTLTSYLTTITVPTTTTLISTVTSLESTTTTTTDGKLTTTETSTSTSSYTSTTTTTEYAVERFYTTTTTTTTMTITETPIKYSKWFQVLVEDNRGIIVEGLTYTQLDFLIDDWTRGPGSGVPPAALPQGYSYARQITVQNHLAGDILEAGYTVEFTLDTASLVSSGKMQASGEDLRIFYYKGAWIELNRHVLGMNTDSTEVRFKTQADIPSGDVDGNYFLCYGNPAANNPPSNLADVYVFYDDFSLNTTSTYDRGRWLSLHGSSGYVYPRWNNTGYWIDFDTGDNIVCGLRHNINGDNLYAEVKLSWAKSYPNDATVGIGIRWRSASKYYVGHVSYGSYTSPAIARNSRENYIATPPTNTHFPKDGTWHKLAFAVWDDKLKLWLDGVEYLAATDSAIGKSGSNEVAFEFAQMQGSADDLMVRKYVEPEPTADVGFEAYGSGARFSSSDTYETYNLEVMYNASTGTAWYWNGEQLKIRGGYPPIPPVPIRQLRVNTTTLGVGDRLNETPSQVEQWSSDLKKPLYVLSIGNISARFNDRSKLTFNVNFPWNVTTQQVRIWWQDDLEVAPPFYGINMTVAGPFVIVDNGRYKLQLLAEKGYSTWIDWSISLRYAGYHAEYALFGYDVYEIPPAGSGRYWFPMKIPAGSWDTPVVYGPVRAIVHRRSNVVYDYPNNIQINDELDHEMYIVVPYNVKYFFWRTNSTWLKTVDLKGLTFISMISGDQSDTGNATLRVGKYAYQDTQGWVRTGRYIDYATEEHLGKSFGYWSAQYRDGFGEAMFVNNHFLDLIKNGTRHPRPDLYIFSSYDYARRVAEYDAEDMIYGSHLMIQKGTNYALSVAAWAYDGGWEQARLYHRMFLEQNYPTIFVMSP